MSLVPLEELDLQDELVLLVLRVEKEILVTLDELVLLE